METSEHLNRVNSSVFLTSSFSRLLNDMEIGDKNLMVKADAKTKEMLAKYETERRTSAGNGNADDYDEMAKKVRMTAIEYLTWRSCSV